MKHQLLRHKTLHQKYLEFIDTNLWFNHKFNTRTYRAYRAHHKNNR